MARAKSLQLQAPSVKDGKKLETTEPDGLTTIDLNCAYQLCRMLWVVVTTIKTI